ncbi:hypothetical protein QP938_08420 [Porticoccaceae bacterium LTM1]|nr:hypothetical protein QP938_08420 [Porticoccaceae bacterium LTM1]
MAKLFKRSRITLILGMVAGLALVIGVLSIFEIPSDTLTGVLIRLVGGLLAFVVLGFLLASAWVGIKRLLGRR